jgi:choline dehydrogenase-like flavoprotein
MILTGAEVREILLSHEDNSKWVAKGVRFTHSDCDDFKTYASREVIISAGSVQSPQLLELSGIGGAELLSRAGISAKVDNKNVGENLQDHTSKLSHLP